MPVDGTLFYGGSLAPERDFVSKICVARDYERIAIPCAGRLAIAVAMASHGVPPERIRCGDITLFSGLVGYAVTGQDLDELGIELDPVLNQFVEDAADDMDWVCGLLVGMKWSMFGPAPAEWAKTARVPVVIGAGNENIEFLRRQLRYYRKEHRAYLRGQLEQMAAVLGGMTYANEDMFVTMDWANDRPDSFIYLCPPWYKGDYEAMYANIEALVKWNEPNVEFFNPDNFRSLYERYSAENTQSDVFVTFGHDPSLLPESWRVIYAEDIGKKQNQVMVTRSAANRDLDSRYAHFIYKPPKVKKTYALYDDEEITAASVTGLVRVDAATAAYYRDLFVAARGKAAAAFVDYLFVIDGRVAGVCGLDDAGVRKDGHVKQAYAVTFGSRYPLADLLSRLLCSGQTKELLLQSFPVFTLQEPVGIQTTQGGEEETKGGIRCEMRRQPFGDGLWTDALTEWVDGLTTEEDGAWTETAASTER